MEQMAKGRGDSKNECLSNKGEYSTISAATTSHFSVFAFPPLTPSCFVLPLHLFYFRVFCVTLVVNTAVSTQAGLCRVSGAFDFGALAPCPAKEGEKW